MVASLSWSELKLVWSLAEARLSLAQLSPSLSLCMLKPALILCLIVSSVLSLSGIAIIGEIIFSDVRCLSDYFLIFLWIFWNLNILLTFQIFLPLHISVNEKKNVCEGMTGLEPAILRFEVWCVIHCATYPHCTYLLSYISNKWKYFNPH